MRMLEGGYVRAKTVNQFPAIARENSQRTVAPDLLPLPWLLPDGAN
jgi:hypothetical protein